MAVGTGHSASAPKRLASNALVQHEATTITGGEGPSGNSQPHGKTDLGLDDIEEFLYDDADGPKEVDINELEVYMKEKPIRWVDPTGEEI
ncbi:hypothetical protein E2562_012133 [Oryza meyeriana var. granulata]|uniref:Uncharacterized protein n=1 Tax=Oryza meyeriana var. granulata TaxID=110450 RepID=A0A6G1F790_9ORYZ|nr:hypothetical protein E2562_012133 [Oryza meyeriana var. granulata]